MVRVNNNEYFNILGSKADIQKTKAENGRNAGTARTGPQGLYEHALNGDRVVTLDQQ